MSPLPAPQPFRQHSAGQARRFFAWAARHAFFIVVFIASAWYAAANLNRGWVPHDDGALAQSAERVLRGELPHRDFAEIYTGALDYPHALAFRIFGTTFTSLRLVLFAAFLVWLPVVYRVALFSGPPWIAAGMTLLAAVWTIPNYSASMPSWYNLFLATASVLALMQFAKSRRTGWLFAAGLCCGTSIIVKVTGTYALAAAVLACVYMQESDDEQAASRPALAYPLFVVVSLLLFLATLVRVLGERANPRELFAFLLPCALISYLLIRRGLRLGGRRLATFGSLFRTLAPLLLGTLLPIAIFVAPYLVSHSSDALINGTLIAPFRRVNVTVAESPELLRTWPALVLVTLLIIVSYFRLRPAVQALIGAAGLCFLYVSADSVALLQSLWHSAFDVVPYLALAITLWMIVAHRQSDEGLFILLVFVACCNLSRFPFSGPIYFCYIAPLVFLAVQAWLAETPRRSMGTLLTVLVFFVAFEVMRIKPPFLVEMGADYVPDQYVAPFSIERARGIRTREEVVRVYEEVARLVREHSAGTIIYAGPDAPEVYFMAEKKNPTRDIFNFLNQHAVEDAGAALDRQPIDVVVWNRGPQFSHEATTELQRRIARDYPNVQQIGSFDVRWK